MKLPFSRCSAAIGLDIAGRWIKAVQEVLSQVQATTLEQLAEVPAAYRGSLVDRPMTVRACLLHAIEHSALHLGHIQITRSMLLRRA